MLWLLLAAVTLSPPFGEATASATPAGPGLLSVDLEVEVEGSPLAVVAHIGDPGGEAERVALAERSPGRWGGLADVRETDYLVVFEVLYEGGASSLSRQTSLSELGVELATGPPGPSPSPPGWAAPTLRWGWAALALAAVSLALLAVWALGEDRSRS